MNGEPFQGERNIGQKITRAVPITGNAHLLAHKYRVGSPVVNQSTRARTSSSRPRTSSVLVGDQVVARKDSNGFPSEEDALAAVQQALSVT